MEKVSLILLPMVIFAFFSMPKSAHSTDLTGMWWDKDKPGSGIFISHSEEDGVVCGSWYLYDDKGKPTWFTFWGLMRDNRMQASLYKFFGPPLGQEWNSELLHSLNVGVVDMTFYPPDKIQIRYDLDNASGKLHLERFSLTSCSGNLLWDPKKPGQGMARFHFHGPTGEMSGLVWYVFDKDGNATWYTATGNVGAHTFDLWSYTGPSLLGDWNRSLVKVKRAGSVDISIQSVDVATQRPTNLNIHLKLDELGDGQAVDLELQPFKCPVAVPTP